MNELTPQELANLWYSKFGHKWMICTDLSDEWRNISRTLMKNNLADYDMVSTPSYGAIKEIIKLKENN